MEADLHEQSYHRQIALLIEALDRPNFWLLLVRTLKTLIEFDNWVALCFTAHQKPDVYIENPAPEGTPDLLFQDYINGLYLLDPFYIASFEQTQSGLYTLDQVAPENFMLTDYFRLYFQRNIVVDEIQFNCQLGHGKTLCFSMGRGTRYTPGEIGLLKLIEPWVIALMKQRMSFEANRTESGAPAKASAHAYALSAQNRAKLTDREFEISQLVLSGFSGKNISEKLKISIETVRAHKKHIYNKLNINSQSELFSMFYQSHQNQ